MPYTFWDMLFSSHKITFFIWWPWPMTLTLKADPEVIQVQPRTKFEDRRPYTFRHMIFSIEFFTQTDGQKAMHMSPLCISTGGLNKGPYSWFPYVSPDIKLSKLSHLTHSVVWWVRINLNILWIPRKHGKMDDPSYLPPASATRSRS